MSVSPRDALQEVLDETRQRFVGTFAAQCDAIAALVDQVAAGAAAEPAAELRHLTHRLSGLAGTIGFPTISECARQLETLTDEAPLGGFDAVLARQAVAAMRAGFTTDLARALPEGRPARAVARGARILVAEDEPDQRLIVTTGLEGAGFDTLPVASGDLVVDLARAERPALILLDIAMPGLDGYSVCRLLKADPALRHIPVMFMTAGANLDDKLAGLMLGADEFLSKPVDMRELVLRIELLLRKNPGAPAPASIVSRDLTYDAFLAAADLAMARTPAALAIVRVPAARRDDAARVLTEEIRGRDLLGVYGPARLMVLMPGLSADEARLRIGPMLDRMIALDLIGICAGVTGAPQGDAAGVESLVAQADEALAEASYLGVTSAVWREKAGRPVVRSATRTVVIAEDDPDVTRIVDAQVRASGHIAVVAFDGEQALAAVAAHAPDVLVLDLMMPRLSGFDVLAQLKDGAGPRPRVIVLTGRGREQDVVRAFELGADDYMTKPFNPQELLARITRLLK